MSLKEMLNLLYEIEKKWKILTQYLEDGKIDILFTNASARAGYDTRSIFKRSLAGLNSEFSYS